MSRIFRFTSLVLLVLLLLGTVAIFLSPQGKALIAQIEIKLRTGELEGALRFSVGRKWGALRRVPNTIETTVEDQRFHLPEFRTIPALAISDRTPANPHSDGALEGSIWTHSFGNTGSQKYADIPWFGPTEANRLAKVWTYDTPHAVANIQSTPVFTGQLLVFPDARHRIVALMPDSGELVWEFNPGINQPARRGMVFISSGDTQAGSGTVYFAAGGRVFSLDALTGLPNPTFGRSGSIAVGYTVRIAPQIYEDLLFVGSFMPGVHAFDRHTGERKWTTDLLTGEVTRTLIGRLTVRHPSFGGANPWGGMTLDTERGLLFLGLSNPGPVAYGAGRIGDNYPANSVLAINARNGEVVWGFQEVRHDLWDLDIASPPVLATITDDAAQWDVVAIAGKTGNLMILDRLTGEPIFDWRLRRAPTSTVPGERTSAYQPDPLLPEPFGKMTFTLDDVTDIGERNRESVTAQLEEANFGFYHPHEPGRETIFFGLHGGAMHAGTALDRENGILFVSASHVPSSFTISQFGGQFSQSVIRMTGNGVATYSRHCAACHGDLLEGGLGTSLSALDSTYTRERFANVVTGGLRSMPAMPELGAVEIDALYSMLVLGDGIVRDNPQADDAQNLFVRGFQRTPYRKLRDHEGYPGSKPPWGTLTAIDLNTGRHIWRVPLGRHDELMARGLSQTGTENISGPAFSSGGVVFVSGTMDRLIRAFDASTGQEVWEAELPFIGSASPMIFEYGGAAYVVVPATGGGTLGLYRSDVHTGGAFVAFRSER